MRGLETTNRRKPASQPASRLVGSGWLFLVEPTTERPARPVAHQALPAWSCLEMRRNAQQADSGSSGPSPSLRQPRGRSLTAWPREIELDSLQNSKQAATRGAKGSCCCLALLLKLEPPRKPTLVVVIHKPDRSVGLFEELGRLMAPLQQLDHTTQDPAWELDLDPNWDNTSANCNLCQNYGSSCRRRRLSDENN